jgi:hypothetical protein
MGTTIDVICQKQKTLKNGESTLQIRLTKKRKRKYLSIGISVKPEYWDFEKNKPKYNCPSREYIETVIQEKITAYRKQILDFKMENIDFAS